MSRAKLKGCDALDPSIRTRALARCFPNSAFSSNSPSARATTRPVWSSAARPGLERVKWLCRVRSHSSPSANIPRTMIRCEAPAPHKVACFGTTRRDTVAELDVGVALAVVGLAAGDEDPPALAGDPCKACERQQDTMKARRIAQRPS